MLPQVLIVVAEVVQAVSSAYPSSVFPHFPDKNLLPIGYQDEVSIHAIDTTRGPGGSVIPLCLLRPPQGGFYIEGIPSQPASLPPDEDSVFHSDPHAVLLVLDLSRPFRYRGQTDYIFCMGDRAAEGSAPVRDLQAGRCV
ncbi:uncharacterized protein TRAVEDRAFT_54087 [Trametes versicolor FP-101664 SS1]|uniref:Velvet domain-containing protein n=1 Tax=Trametes versicolor (strain FP-101664) TaxID=717944 RepID=R7S7T7_TRAVS|nr:uncharacterized protein TRAVEDRAFT_54087 [Trametes versicolor FP-101664 SS1]EIW52113.1 hypothetical protein TRAVEDRAFT_54087 [Trametes versicolor FP-101664 SS1]